MAKKRISGTGSVYKDSKGRWVGQVVKGYNDDGHAIYKRFYGKTQAEVVRRMSDYQLLLKQGDSCLQDVFLGEYLVEWMEQIKKPALKPTSYDRAMTTIRLHIVPFIGHYLVTELTPQLIQVELIDALCKKGLAYFSIKKAYVYLNACLTYAINAKQLVHNPCKLVDIRKSAPEKKNIRCLNEEEIKAFVTAAESRYNNGVYKIKFRKLLLLDLNTGLRVGELCALKWTDVDFEKRTINICKNVVDTYNFTNGTKHRKKVHLVQNSAKSRDRVVPLNKTALMLLREMYDEAKDKKGFIACGSKPGNNHTLSRNYQRVCRLAGIENCCGIHTLRHTFASRLFRKGVDVKIVSSILGHSDTGFTYNTYIHLMEGQAQSAVDLLDDE